MTRRRFVMTRRINPLSGEASPATIIAKERRMVR